MRWFLVLLLLPSAVLAGPREDYAALLRVTVKSDGVDYEALRRERAALDAWVRSLEGVAPGATEPERIAFWINVYNGLTLQQVLDTMPETGDYSVRDVRGFWTKRAWEVAGRVVTLDDIEKRILQEEHDEPRVHFALNCASRSCPPLSPELYDAATLDAVLTRQTRAFLANGNENRFDIAQRRAGVSKIFSWYRSDFEPLQEFLASHAPSEPLARSLREQRWSFSYLDYDWALNESGKPRAERKRGIHPVWMIAYLLATLGLMLYGFHAFKMLFWRYRHGARYLEELQRTRRRSSLARADCPEVLVQVPVFNEPAVVTRAIDAVAALDYPALEIQILDDSTDETVALVDDAVARHRARGVPIRVLRRSHRDGFKAGALAEGLTRSEAPFVAIFDADFTPHPDFVRRALPLFDMPGRVACVQGRWSHLNRHQNWLTRAQAVGVDAHFRVQQLARAATGAFLNFNGTAGMWRREAIEEAGGWRGDTLTEDLDLSYRAQLRGWRIVFDPDLDVPAELPPTLGAYKSQQRRWACGSIQCARRFLAAVWRSSEPLHVKVEASVHLCGYLVCVAMMSLVLLLPYGLGHLPMMTYYPHLWPLWIGIWAAASGPIVVSVVGQFLGGRWAFREVVLCFLLGLGSCANNALAVLRGFFRPIRTFVRTPKQGSRPRPVRTEAPLLEQTFMLFTLAVVVLLARTRPWAIAAYALFCSAGFCFLALYWWLAERRTKPT
jgi:cellulose synthase/poly-beta-1,6-N-acetylglucosamine synthase-like glycosyltransferase